MLLVDGAYNQGGGLNGAAGWATFSALSNLAVGTHTLQVRYYDPSGSFVAQSSVVNFTVVPNNLPVPFGQVKFNPVDPVVGVPVTITATLSCGSSCGAGSGYFLVDGSYVGYGTLVNGVAVMTTTASGSQWTAGTHTVSFDFFGNPTYSNVNTAPQNFTVLPPFAQQPLAVSLTVPASPFAEGERVEMLFTTSCPSPCSVGNGGIDVWVDGNYYSGGGATPNSFVTWSYGLQDIGVGQHTLDVRYTDSSGRVGESPVSTFTVVPNTLPIPSGALTLNPPSPIVGSHIGINVAMSCGAACAGTAGYLYVDGVYSGGNVLDANGAAPFTALAVNNAPLSAGPHSAYYWFFGNGSYSSTQVPISFTVAAVPKVYDSGAVSLTINGISEVVPYSSTQNTTSSGLISALASAINSDPRAVVKATANTSGLTLTALNGGAASDYAYSFTDSYDSIDFSQPSFSATPGAGTLSGGTSAVLTQAPIYSYSITQQGGSSGYDPTGNIVAYTDSVNGSWQFGYDSLNRLTYGTGQAPTASQPSYYCWAYDSFGNRLAQNVSNQAFPANTGARCQAAANANVTINQATYNSSNQITSLTAPGVPVNPTYDPLGGGAIVNDGTSSYAYDAEGRICAQSSPLVSGGSTYVQYLYNAEGQRVAKGTITPVTVNGHPTLSCDITVNGFTLTNQYLLGPSGEQVTELNGSGTWVHTNVYAGATLLGTYDNPALAAYASNPGIHFHLTDWLGSRRAQTNYAGTLEATYSSLPYGDGLNASGTLDPTEQHFTGKERDAESGLDYFGARYYASNMGRWMSPDWSAKYEPVPYAKLDNPQSLNLYSYVFNNPLSHLDDDGHEVITVQLRAYIPQASVGPYRGDNRGPTASQTVNSRTAITLTIETDPSISANPLLYNSGGIAGTTHNDWTGNSATQTVGLPTAQVSRDADGNVVINIQQNAANPLTPAAVTPGIQSNVTVGVPVNGSSVTTSGTVSGAPAFELNVQTPGNPTTNIPLQPNPPTNPIAFGAALSQTNKLPTTTTPLPAPCQGSNCHQ
jgi:RHS repeat-associated protein